MISIVKYVIVHLESLKFCQYVSCFSYLYFRQCLVEKVKSCAHWEFSYSVFPVLHRKNCSCVEAPAVM